MFHPGGGGYFVPTAVPQGAGRAAGYIPGGGGIPAAAQLRGAANPRWQTATIPRPSQSTMAPGMLQGYRPRIQTPAAAAAAMRAAPPALTSQQAAAQRTVVAGQQQAAQANLMQQRNLAAGMQIAKQI